MPFPRNLEPKKIEAVIFDLDGTLLNSLEDIAESMNEALAHFGLPPHSLDDYKYMVGNGLRPLVERALPPAKRNPSLLDQVEQQLRLIYQQRWDQKTRLYPEIPELLDKLTARQLSLNILSNKPHEYTVVVAEKFLRRWSFDVILGQKKELPKKPAPDGAWLVAKTLNIKCEQIVFLGDTEIDIETAHRAGMRPVGVEWGFRTSEELRQAGAAVVLRHPLELLKWLAL